MDQNERADWTKMVTTIQTHIKTLNWGFKADLIKAKVKFFPCYASFIDPHRVQLRKANGDTSEVTAAKFVVAVGGRPSYPEIPGAREFGISSDDIFSKKTNPGKTLVVGASYVALECAGFMKGFDFLRVLFLNNTKVLDWMLISASDLFSCEVLTSNVLTLLVTILRRKLAARLFDQPLQLQLKSSKMECLR